MSRSLAHSVRNLLNASPKPLWREIMMRPLKFVRLYVRAPIRFYGGLVAITLPVLLFSEPLTGTTWPWFGLLPLWFAYDLICKKVGWIEVEEIEDNE